MNTPTKSPRIVALIIGRGNNTLRDKNILPVLGRPLLHYTAGAARRSKYIGRFYISSDCPRILEAGRQMDYTPIVRPAELAKPESQSTDAVVHAMDTIEAEGPADILVVQHANVGTIKTEWIDECIESLINDSTLSAVVPMHEVPEYHPYRAKTLTSDGMLTPFFDFTNRKISANRQELPPCLFFDHSIWVLSVPLGVRSCNGQPPWPCMGSRIKPFVTKGCFDVHTAEDLEKTAQWLMDNGIPSPEP